MKQRNPKYLSIISCLVGVLVFPWSSPAASKSNQRGAGPFVMISKRGEVSVRLLRRDKDLVWVLQKSRTGDFIETGVAIKHIQRFHVPEPKLFGLVEKVKTDEQSAKVQVQLKKYVEQLAPFRDLPGMRVDEAQMLRGRLYEKNQRWDKALPIYEDVLKQTYGPSQLAEAKLRAGMCYAHQGLHKNALKHIDIASLTDDDLDLLSDVYFARAGALKGLGRIDEALQSYLYLVVFYPFVNENEPRCLAAVLDCYAALTDWDSAYKTTQALLTDYEGTEAAKKAEAFIEEHQTHMAKEESLHESIDAEEFEEEEGVYDEFE